MTEKIIYRYESGSDTLYLNIIGRFACINSCVFCGKPVEENDHSYPEHVYGEGLYLKESPNIEAIMDSIKKEIKPTDKILSFVGLGEPLLYFPKVLKILRKVKKEYILKTKIDTCGLVQPFFPNAIERLEEAELDMIYISLNATTAEEYKLLCRPKIDDAFFHLLNFIEKANASKIATYVSFILDYYSEEIQTKQKEEYLKFALSLRLKESQIKWRKYMPVS